jgi:glutathione S-transferase
MKLYYSPGACSLADHIALTEADIKVDLVKVDLKTHKLEDGSSFYDINPKGYVPVLELDDGARLTENVAILTFIADRYPALVPPGELGRYRLLEMLAYIATEIHKAFHPLFHPDGGEAERADARDALARKFGYVAGVLKSPYLFGEKATAADAYLFVMLTWAKKQKIDVPSVLDEFMTHMKSRPTVVAALNSEGLRTE